MSRLDVVGRVRGIGGGAPLLPLLVLFGLNAVDELDRTAFGVVLPEIQKHFGLTDTALTGLIAAIIPASLLFGVPIAFLADRHRRIPIAVAGASAWALFSVGTGLALTVVVLAFMRIGAGLGRAVNDPVHGSLLSDYYPPLARAKVFGAHRAANTVGAFCGPLIAGFVAAVYGWRMPFIILALPTLVLVILAIVFLREPPRTGRGLTEGSIGFFESLRVLWKVRTLRRLWTAIPFLAVVVIALAPLVAVYYERIFGVTVAGRGVIQAFDAPFILLGLLFGTPLIDKGIQLDAGRTLRMIGLLAATIGVLIAGIAVAPTLWLAVAFVYAIQTMAIVLTAGGIAIISLVAPPEARAMAFAFYGVFALVGVVALPMVGVVSDSFGLRWAIGILPPILVMGGAFVASAGRYVVHDIAVVVGRDLTKAPTKEEAPE